MFLDDDRPKKVVPAQVGEPLADLSLADLKVRIDIYRAEIERLERELEAKEKSRTAADSFFRL